MGNRADLFKAAAQEAEKEKTSKGSYTPREYEETDYLDLETNAYKVMRVFGEPVNVRTDPCSPKLIQTSRILGDNGKQFICNWSDDRKWLMWEFFNKIMEYKWDPEALNPSDPTRKGAKIYINAEKYPALYKRVRWNNREDNSMERGWNPNSAIVMNVIDREHYDWHHEHKAFKLISKKGNVDKSDSSIVYHDAGIPITCYDMLLKSVVEENGDWEDFDIAIHKLSDKPWYEVYSAMDERKIASKIKVKMSVAPLTEEERSWKKYNFDTKFAVTSYTKILNRLGDFMDEVDVCLKTNFKKRFTELSEKEKATWASEKTEEEVEESETTSEEIKKEVVTIKEPVAEIKTRTPLLKGKEDFFEAARKAGWKGIDQTEKEYKNLIQSITISADGKSDKIIYKDDAGITVPLSDTLPCGVCGLDNVEFIPICPKCGTEY
jgi:hypothetical protein